MARTLPTSIIQEMNKETSSVLLLALLEISHSAFATVRLVNNTEDVISNGDLYQAFPFSVVLPPDTDDSLPFLRVSLSNVTRELVDEARGIAGSSERAKASIRLVEFADPDTVLAAWTDYDVRGIKYDQNMFQFQMTVETFLVEPFPGDAMNPTNVPGVF